MMKPIRDGDSDPDDSAALHDAMLELETNGNADGDSSKESSGIENDAGSPEVGKPNERPETTAETANNDKVGDHVNIKPERSKNEGCSKEIRGSVKKQGGYNSALSQHRRRKETLQWQKQRRDEILDKIRQLEDSAYSDSETEDEMDFVASVRDATGIQQPSLQGISEECSSTANVEAMDAAPSSSTKHRSKRKNKKDWRQRYKQAPCQLMLSEWMLEVPEDFEDNKWLGVVCPVGKRVIVFASRGKTKIFSRKDEFLGSYRSLLPGGSRYNYSVSSTNRNRGITILDCIWSQPSQTFYVLDMICWNSHSCGNCDTDYRQFFLHSKFSENLELLESSASNPFPFKPLMYFEASETSTILSSPINFPEEIDGIIYIHKEAFYISETNPLCLWILLTQVESILNIYVIPELLARQVKPKNLRSRKEQIKRVEQSRNKEAQDMEVQVHQ